MCEKREQDEKGKSNGYGLTLQELNQRVQGHHFDRYVGP